MLGAFPLTWANRGEKAPLLYWNAESVRSHMLCWFLSGNRVVQALKGRRLWKLSPS